MKIPRAPVAAALAAAMLTAGCGASDRDQVSATVLQLAASAAARDYGTICGQVLAPSLLARLTAGGITCRQAMAIAFDSVRDPRISIGRIVLQGDRAEVITLSTAQNQQASIETVKLVRVSDGWRISALASPLNAPRH